MPISMTHLESTYIESYTFNQNTRNTVHRNTWVRWVSESYLVITVKTNKQQKYRLLFSITIPWTPHEIVWWFLHIFRTGMYNKICKLRWVATILDCVALVPQFIIFVFVPASTSIATLCCEYTVFRMVFLGTLKERKKKE
jgi:hypothetical protein